MNVTWVKGYPSGHEKGNFLALDMGGTNLRVCEVDLSGGQGEFEITQKEYRIPDELKTGTADQLWDFIAEEVRSFVHQRLNAGQTSSKIPLAFTFSYPVHQPCIDRGVLQRWTKDFDVAGVEGSDVVIQLEAALERKKVPVRVVALVNDTTGTLIASSYSDPEVKIGSIFGTGCNAAYMEECGSIPKIKNSGLPADTLIAINTEYGAFDSEHKVLPQTRFDKEIDRLSPRPGQQSYEKMVASLYLGGLLRLVLLELGETGKMFKGQDISRLRTKFAINCQLLTEIEADHTQTLTGVRDLFKTQLGIELAPHERRVLQFLTELIGARAARLYACGIAAICKKKKIDRCHVGVDGSAFSKNAVFQERAAQALREILQWPDDTEDKITLQCAQDGSGVGAALIASLALERGDGAVHSAS
ncbi:hypothetical protein MAP00_006776 [Monascus purpureus]|nr:hypothetical protein MAP00_006776 [Monascus purpureus]